MGPVQQPAAPGPEEICGERGAGSGGSIAAMKEILINTLLGIAWLALTILQVRFIGGTLNADGQLGTGASLFAWLGGQLVILTPILLKIWRERTLGNAPE